MGFLGGGSDAQKQNEQLENQQIQQNQAELEAKKQNLYQTRLDIIKSQGGESWSPSYGSPLPPNINASMGKVDSFSKQFGGMARDIAKKAGLTNR